MDEVQRGDFRARMAHYRKARGWSATKLAAELEKTEGTVRNYENGTSTCSIPALYKFCDVMNLTMLEFWGPLK